MFLCVNRNAACGSFSKLTPRGGFLLAGMQELIVWDAMGCCA